MSDSRITISNYPFKSYAAAVWLCFFAGPVGLSYASFRGAIKLTVVFLLLLILPWVKVAFALLIFLWVICPFLAVRAVEKYNRALLNQLIDDK